jgi:hypothetical protein
MTQINTRERSKIVQKFNTYFLYGPKEKILSQKVMNKLNILKKLKYEITLYGLRRGANGNVIAKMVQNLSTHANGSTGGPRYMRSFYLRIRVYAIRKWRPKLVICEFLGTPTSFKCVFN